MDSEWTHSTWQPTLVEDEEDDTVKRYIDEHTNYSRPRRSGKTVGLLISSIQACTKVIRGTPYSPSVWIDRGKCLLKMQYPELAAGDAYKATLLLEKFRKGEIGLANLVGTEILHELDLDWISLSKCSTTDLLISHQEEVNMRSCGLERKAYTLLAQALLTTHSFEEAFKAFEVILQTSQTISRLEILRETILTAWGNQASLWRADGMSLNDIKQDEKFGAVLIRRYPWMGPELSTRSLLMVQQANASIRQISGATCFVGESKIRGIETDVLGLFAGFNLATDKRVLKDFTILCADDGSVAACSTCCKSSAEGNYVALSCCDMIFCSQRCWNRAEACHKLRCGRDLEEYEKARATPLVSAEKVTDDRGLLKVLMTLACENAPHPLQSDAIGALTASYNGENPDRFSLEADIVRPIDMLTRLGVDVFANETYDTWVIMTILVRIRTNSRESHVNDRHLIAINPLYSYFNHSCDPNVIDDTNDKDTSSTLTLKTTRPVRAYQELFISYLHEDDLKLPRNERNEQLRQWIGRDCACTRCLAEAAEDTPQSTEHLDASGEEMGTSETVEAAPSNHRVQHDGPWVVIPKRRRERKRQRK